MNSKVCDLGYVEMNLSIAAGYERPTCIRTPDRLRACEMRNRRLVEEWEKRRTRRNRIEACVGFVGVSHGAIEITSLAGIEWSRVEFEDREDREWSQIVLGFGPAIAIDLVLLPLQLALAVLVIAFV